MRCKACDAVMTEEDLGKVKEDGSQEDLCLLCLGRAFDGDDELIDDFN